MEDNEFAVTVFFKNIFPTYDDFKSWLTEYTTLDSNNELNEYLYKKLMQKYANENINYATLEAFKRNFAITYEDNFEQYEVRKRIITQTYNLSAEDLTIAQEAINNIALNNNEILDDAKDPLDTKVNFISNQSTSRVKQAKLDSYITAIASITSQLLNDYLEKFRKHFMTVYLNPKYMYYDNED